MSINMKNARVIKTMKWEYSNLRILIKKLATNIKSNEYIYDFELQNIDKNNPLINFKSDSSKIIDIPELIHNLIELNLQENTYLTDKAIDNDFKLYTYTKLDKLDEYFDDDYFMSLEKSTTVTSIQSNLSNTHTSYTLNIGYPFMPNIFSTLMFPEIPEKKISELKHSINILVASAA